MEDIGAVVDRVVVAVAERVAARRISTEPELQFRLCSDPEKAPDAEAPGKFCGGNTADATDFTVSGLPAELVAIMTIRPRSTRK